MSDAARISMLLHAYCICVCYSRLLSELMTSSTGTNFRIRVKVDLFNVDLTIEGPSEREAIAFALNLAVISVSAETAEHETGTSKTDGEIHWTDEIVKLLIETWSSFRLSKCTL